MRFVDRSSIEPPKWFSSDEAYRRREQILAFYSQEFESMAQTRLPMDPESLMLERIEGDLGAALHHLFGGHCAFCEREIDAEAFIHRYRPPGNAGPAYDTSTAQLIAGDDYWDGNNWERHGRNTFLFRTPKGSYFAQHLTQWQGERDTLEPLTQDEAVSLFEELGEKRVSFQEAFPGVEIEEA